MVAAWMIRRKREQRLRPKVSPFSLSLSLSPNVSFSTSWFQGYHISIKLVTERVAVSQLCLLPLPFLLLHSLPIGVSMSSVSLSRIALCILLHLIR
jgi:O-antigen/teichoic acid export membrane protein